MTFAEKVRTRRPLLGTLVTNPSPVNIGAIRALGADFVLVDTEHVCLDRTGAAALVNAVGEAGIGTVLRVPAAAPHLVSMALDANVCGVMVPYLEEVEDAALLGATLRYRPLKGRRLLDLAHGREVLSPGEAEYLRAYNGERLFLPQIESRRGIENLPAMLETGLVDGVVVGPHDLSVSLGVPEQYTGSTFLSAVAEIIGICQERQVTVGSFCFWGAEEAARLVGMGANLILYGPDFPMYADAFTRAAAVVRSAFQESEEPHR